MGPLKGVKVVEFAGLGPAPFAVMMLSDMGADVIRIDRVGTKFDPLANPGKYGVTNRGRRSVALDLKSEEGVKDALALIEGADILVEGFRPGVMEKLGLGPDTCHKINPKLIYGRMTGWGQEGPLSKAAGHDINYISLSGALDAIGQKGQKPAVPLNLVGDFGGGAVILAFGIVCALHESKVSGKGQVVDAAMCDGSAYLMSMIYGLKAQGLWDGERGSNLLDGGAHFYDTYECADGKFISIGPLEPQFYELLRRKIDLGEGLLTSQEPADWEDSKETLGEIFKGKSQGEWCALLEGTDVCFAPIMTMDEAPSHHHNEARGVFVEVEGVIQPAPAPRFSRTPGGIQSPPPTPGGDTVEVLSEVKVKGGAST